MDRSSINSVSIQELNHTFTELSRAVASLDLRGDSDAITQDLAIIHVSKLQTKNGLAVDAETLLMKARNMLITVED
jgi:hypothetical protein